MRKVIIFLVVISMTCISMSGAVNSTLIEETEIVKDQTARDVYRQYSKYLPTNEKEIKNIELPWIETSSSLLEWVVRIEYNGQTFEEEVPVSISDFSEKFLKHPEYGEKLYFDVDNDGKYEIEVIVGFYWSIIKDEDGSEVKSIEKRFRVRQLESGGYLDDPDGELEVWSEIHINYGLFKDTAKSKDVSKPLDNKNTKLSSIINRVKEKLAKFRIFRFLFEKLFSKKLMLDEEKNIQTQADDSDYISLGAGYRSPEDNHIPLYTEKRFAFARERIFSPTIFQHIMDPGSSAGTSPIELLYGFRSFNSGSSDPAYDIAFSIEFDPAVKLKTKFVPLNAYVYYFFEEESQRNSDTSISFTSNVFKGAGEDIDLSLIFDKIDDTLGQTGRWMSFDLDMLGDNELLGGNFHYKGSHKFTVGVLINSPMFQEKIELLGIPTDIDVSWDLDFSLTPSPIFNAHADGYIDLDMNSDFEGVNVYYPKTDPDAPDEIFIDIPGGLPKSTKVEAAITLNVDFSNLMSNPSNYVYGKLKHTCSSNLDSIRAFLPGEAIPIVKVTEIPAYSEAKGKLYWNTLEGYAYAWRGSSGPPDPVELNIDYQGFHIHDILTVRNGHIDTRFKVANDGHFYFDTSEGMFGNDLEVSIDETGDSLQLYVDEVSADELQADWNLDTSGSQLKIRQLKFGGIVDTLNGLEVNLDYQGKTVDASIDWVLAETGNFNIEVNQQADLILDFSEFAPDSEIFDIDGGITLSQNLQFDMSWKLHQGEKGNGNVDPGFFTINEYCDEPNIKSFDFYITYQGKYGVDVTFDNLEVYLDFEWWKGDRLLPYIWLDYEVSVDDFDLDLLWTNFNGETQWHYNVEDW